MLKIEGVFKHYRLHRSWLAGHEIVKAVDDVSLNVKPGESLGIVGESGCGKSTLAKLIMMLETPTKGSIYFDGQNINELSNQCRRELRRDVQIVFQDTYASLNPRLSIRQSLEEPILNFSLERKFPLEKRLQDMLDIVELPKSMLLRYPSELSGGERQRVCIARALILQPRFIIFDEATSGLDVTLQRQILAMLKKLRREMGLTYLFITHNLKLIPYITEKVAVMYKGKVVEMMDSSKLNQAVHPYTQMLLAAIPVTHPQERRIRDVNIFDNKQWDEAKKNNGCNFYPRCSNSDPICGEIEPKLARCDHGGMISCRRSK